MSYGAGSPRLAGLVTQFTESKLARPCPLSREVGPWASEWSSGGVPSKSSVGKPIWREPPLLEGSAAVGMKIMPIITSGVFFS